MLTLDDALGRVFVSTVPLGQLRINTPIRLIRVNPDPFAGHSVFCTLDGQHEYVFRTIDVQRAFARGLFVPQPVPSSDCSLPQLVRRACRLFGSERRRRHTARRRTTRIT